MSHKLFLVTIVFCLLFSQQVSAQTEKVRNITEPSGVDTVILDKQQMVNLILLGQTWGFLKYHHPGIAKGNYNMDVELFAIMPAVIKAKSNAELSAVIEKWVDKFGVPDLCKRCKMPPTEEVAHQPDYGSIFNNEIYKSSLIGKLQYILNNRNLNGTYYVGKNPLARNPIFNNEFEYQDMKYPDAGYRMLCIYRYWNIIQYFYPYKHLIGTNWNEELPRFISKFVKVANKTEYALAIQEMISSIHDGHAFSMDPNIEKYVGVFSFPFKAKFIENKLVITDYYIDTLNVKQLFKVGDVINSIDGVSVDQLVKKYTPIIAAANNDGLLAILARFYLLRSNKPIVLIGIATDGDTKLIAMNTVSRPLSDPLDLGIRKDQPAYNVIDGEIGYLFAGKYKNKDLPDIRKIFDQTKGMIIDMRTYPSDNMTFTFTNYVTVGKPAVKISSVNLDHPGLFTYSLEAYVRNAKTYKGKIIILVNEISFSNAEFETVYLQSSPNVKVIGSTTGGTDGNVSLIVLPGRMYTWISGIGILYPDGTETQRKGVKIDEVVKPTIAGLKAGRDELLERAITVLKGN
jgi:hypothetical protein